ncbi:MAG: anti-sigma factor [Acidobacteriota bacterium]
MSEERVEREDQAIMLALEMGAGKATAPAARGTGDEAVETMVRLYTEALGMMPHALDPIAPSAGLKGRLMLAAAGDETQEVKSSLVQRSMTAALQVPPPPATKSRQRPPTQPVASPASITRQASRWPLRLAATLAVGLLGLSGWLAWQVQEQNGEIARLRTEARQAKEAGQELVRMREAMRSLEGNVALASSASVLVCPLRTAVGAPSGLSTVGMRAVLYVATDHQHWFFTARGLKESPKGQDYQLWFVANGRPVSGGTFSLKPGEVAHLSSATMPAGTTAVSVTLEHQGGSVLPAGPQVLYGDQMQQVL